MKNSQWKQADSIENAYCQLTLFPPTSEEILFARINELEAKLDRQRKGQFGKIGRLEKRLTDLEERFQWLESGLCKAALQQESHCEILKMEAL